MIRRIFRAALGLVAGCITAPLMLIAWPIFMAWYLFNETDED